MYRFPPQRTHTRGVTLVEVLVGVAIASLILIFSTSAIALFINAGRTASEKMKALYLAEEGLELVRYVRDQSWNNIRTLSTSGTHYLNVSPSTITTSATPESIDGYRRSFTLQNVYRDSVDDIVASTTSGASADTQSKYITMTVAWGSPTTTVSLTSILSNLDP